MNVVREFANKLKIEENSFFSRETLKNFQCKGTCVFILYDYRKIFRKKKRQGLLLSSIVLNSCDRSASASYILFKHRLPLCIKPNRVSAQMT